VECYGDGIPDLRSEVVTFSDFVFAIGAEVIRADVALAQAQAGTDPGGPDHDPNDATALT
jgi:hypothetical protein